MTLPNRLLLWVTFTLTALFSAMHVFVTYEHWHHVEPGESVVAPALMALVTAAAAWWAFRRARR